MSVPAGKSGNFLHGEEINTYLLYNIICDRINDNVLMKNSNIIKLLYTYYQLCNYKL